MPETKALAVEQIEAPEHLNQRAICLQTNIGRGIGGFDVLESGTQPPQVDSGGHEGPVQVLGEDCLEKVQEPFEHGNAHLVLHVVKAENEVIVLVQPRHSLFPFDDHQR